MSTEPREVERFGAVRRAMALARAEGIRRWGADFIDLSGSAPLTAWPPDDVVQRALAVGQPTRAYGPVEGAPEVRAAAARYFARTIGVDLGPENVLISSGALGGLSASLATLCRPGDDVAVATPYYHAYPSLVETVGGRVVRIGTDGRLDPAALVAHAPRAVLLANPANPTGVAYDRHRLDALVGGLPADVPVIADEVYAEYVHEPEDFASIATVPALQGTDRWAVIRSASKTLGRPGLRIGVVLGSARLIEAVADRAAVLTGAASLPAQLAFAAGLDAIVPGQHLRPYRRRLDIAVDLCRQLGLSTGRPQGTYFLWVDGPGAGCVDTALRLCVEAGVFAWPGAHFGSASHLRVSLAVPIAALETGLRRIAACLTIGED